MANIIQGNTNTNFSTSFLTKEFDFTAQPQSNKFVVEAKKPTPSAEETVDEVQRDWPFKMVCEHLCLDLFDPAWDIRHGAGIGLRSIMKAHGDGAGKRGIYACAQKIYCNNK